MQLTFAQIVEHAIAIGASDIHISPNMPPVLRVDGLIREMRVSTQTAEDVANIIYSIMTQAQLELFKTTFEVKFAYETPNLTRYRVNAFTTTLGPSASLRIIPNKIVTLEELEAPHVLGSLSELENGLVLISGLAGSGKTTTLAAMIAHINGYSNKHIITIEDPIEFKHKSDKSLISQREIGASTASYAAALQSSIHEDPDIIIVDELRDYESIRLAALAAEAGCLVLTTTNANSSIQAIQSLIDAFPGDDKITICTMLANSLAGISYQRLIPKAGVAGRIAAYEIMPINSTIRDIIRNNRVRQIQELIDSNAINGLVQMNAYIQKLILRGIIREDQRASNPNEWLNQDEYEF